VAPANRRIAPTGKEKKKKSARAVPGLGFWT